MIVVWAKRPSPFKVSKNTVSFDPKACAEGETQLRWMLGSVHVKILGHKDGQCVFEFTREIEGGYTVYRCQVPVDGPPVTIEVGGAKLVQTPFPLNRCEIIRRGTVCHGKSAGDPAAV